MFLKYINKGKTWQGNPDFIHDSRRERGPDDANNVEVIRITQANRGRYLFKVQAFDLMGHEGNWALVITTDDSNSQIVEEKRGW